MLLSGVMVKNTIVRVQQLLDALWPAAIIHLWDSIHGNLDAFKSIGC